MIRLNSLFWQSISALQRKSARKISESLSSVRNVPRKNALDLWVVTFPPLKTRNMRENFRS